MTQTIALRRRLLRLLAWTIAGLALASPSRAGVMSFSVLTDAGVNTYGPTPLAMWTSTTTARAARTATTPRPPPSTAPATAMRVPLPAG